MWFMAPLILPKFILYAQHGWADNHWGIERLAQSLTGNRGLAIAPDLGWFNTWIRIEPLILKVEQMAIANFAKYPQIPIRIIGHSLGGLIWLELLNRHPEWWSGIQSLVLVGSPVGGSHLARMIDPWGIGLGMARDLGINRRTMAEAIALVIPTLTIAGDTGKNSDGTVRVESTQFKHAKSQRLWGVNHAALKNHPQVAKAVREFWQELGLKSA